jgi:hypothetical protein
MKKTWIRWKPRQARMPAGGAANRLLRPPQRTRKAAGHKPYTPQFSPVATVTVRRLAWALQVSMPKAVDRVVTALPSLFPPSLVCPLCKDSAKCELCAFNQPPGAFHNSDKGGAA